MTPQKNPIKTYRIEWLDDNANITVLAIVATKDIMRRLADEIARMMIIAPSVFPSESLEKNRIISNIKRGEKHLQAGKEFYFANIGDQVLMATETRI